MHPYAKAIAAAVVAALTAAQTAITMSPTWHAWITVGLAAVGVFAVYRVPNAPADATPVGEPEE